MLAEYHSNLEQLQEEYINADLHPKKCELIHEDDLMEAYVNFWLWPYLFWILFLAAILLPGVIEK
jgi:hypothetical protein